VFFAAPAAQDDALVDSATARFALID
jgi:hypothetical protein